MGIQRVQGVEVPEGWATTALGNVVNFEYGKSLTKKARNEDGGYPVYGSHGIVGKHSDYLVEGPAIIVGRKGAVGQVSFSNENCWPIDTTYYIRDSQHVFLKFVYFLLKSLRLSHLDKSTAIPGLNRNDAYTLNIHLPPLPEQRAIVAKIEELFSKLDKGIESLKKAREQLKVYRQAVLKWAFEGKLTEEWRKKHEIEPAEKLLEKIKEEREKLYQQKLEEWKQAVKEWETNSKQGKKPAKPKKPKEPPPLTEQELAQLPKLPEGWVWVKIGNVAKSMKNGIYKQKHFYSNTGIPCLRMYNIADGKIRWFDIKRMRLTEEEIREYLLKPGDLLINRVNSRELVGKTALITENIESSVYESKNIRLRLLDFVRSDFINYWFLLYSNHYFNRNAQQTVGMASINQEQLANMPVPLATTPEQNAVVQEIETRLSIAEMLEQTIDESLNKAEALRQSILKKAFEGKLLNEQELEEVRNDPEWEPAEKLLEKIKAEKAKLEKQKRTSTRRKKSK